MNQHYLAPVQSCIMNTGDPGTSFCTFNQHYQCAQMNEKKRKYQWKLGTS
jgi:hypothetical protein